MLDILFININELNISNLKDENNTCFLLDYIPNTHIFDNDNIIKLPQFKQSNIIGTNINYYFGFNKLIINYITKHHIPYLLSNIYNIDNNKWSDILTYYYNIYKNKYDIKYLNILNNLLDNLKNIFIKLNKDYLLSLKKMYDLDVSNKSLVEFFDANINIILSKFFHKIKLFYILSIIFSDYSKKYILIYDTDIINSINQYI